MAEERRKGFFARAWQRRWVRVLAVAALVAIPVAAFAGVREWRYIQTDPQFCIGCHLMATPGHKWASSVHAKVACQTCHATDIFQEARLGYEAYIVRKTVVGPHAKVNASVCESCHIQPGTAYKQVADTPGHRVHVSERNFPCLECHVTRLHDFKADTEQCVRCHTGRGSALLLVGQTITPGAHVQITRLETTHCLDCHDFIGKKSPVLKPTAATCRGCHATLDAPPAQIASATPAPLAEAAPVLAMPPGRPIWIGKGHADCMSCHRPHGKALEVPADCLACHKDLLEPTSRHFKDQRLAVCNVCHDPHAKPQ